MSSWISWIGEDPKKKFPPNIFNGDPLDQFEGGIQEVACKKCSQVVKFVTDKEQFNNWNDHTKGLIIEFLERQVKHGECPDHQKPIWV